MCCFFPNKLFTIETFCILCKMEMRWIDLTLSVLTRIINSKSLFKVSQRVYCCGRLRKDCQRQKKVNIQKKTPSRDHSFDEKPESCIKYVQCRKECKQGWAAYRIRYQNMNGCYNVAYASDLICSKTSTQNKQMINKFKELLGNGDVTSQDITKFQSNILVWNCS